ncbi:hypothetical protein YC2023_110526 [Brassica napus]
MTFYSDHNVVSMKLMGAFAFAEMITSYGSEPKVVLITSINPKVVGGEWKVI